MSQPAKPETEADATKPNQRDNSSLWRSFGLSSDEYVSREIGVFRQQSECPFARSDHAAREMAAVPVKARGMSGAEK